MSGASDVFMSYAREDKDTARKLKNALEFKDWEVFVDEQDIPPGSYWAEELEKNLDSARCVVVLWSTDSVASSWVKYEANEAEERGKLVPALIGAVAERIPVSLRKVHAADLVEWGGDLEHAGFTQLVEVVEKRIELGPQVPAEPAISAHVDVRSEEFIACAGVFLSEESGLAREDLDLRATFYSAFAAYLETLPITERLKKQRKLSEQFLGDYGVQVSQLKQLLRMSSKAFDMDGSEFTDDLTIALETFQRASGLEADGIFGPNTFRRLIELSEVMKG